MGASIDSVVGSITDQIVATMMPKIQSLVAKAAEAAEPTVRRVVVEDVLPKFGLAVVIGLIAGGVSAAAIGSYFATRRNPPRRREAA